MNKWQQRHILQHRLWRMKRIPIMSRKLPVSFAAHQDSCKRQIKDEIMNTIPSSPTFTGVITLRKINLFRSLERQFSLKSCEESQACKRERLSDEIVSFQSKLCPMISEEGQQSTACSQQPLAVNSKNSLNNSNSLFGESETFSVNNDDVLKNNQQETIGIVDKNQVLPAEHLSVIPNLVQKNTAHIQNLDVNIFQNEMHVKQENVSMDGLTSCVDLQVLTNFKNGTNEVSERIDCVSYPNDLTEKKEQKVEASTTRPLRTMRRQKPVENVSIKNVTEAVHRTNTKSKRIAEQQNQKELQLNNSPEEEIVKITLNADNPNNSLLKVNSEDFNQTGMKTRNVAQMGKSMRFSKSPCGQVFDKKYFQNDKFIQNDSFKGKQLRKEKKLSIGEDTQQEVIELTHLKPSEVKWAESKIDKKNYQEPPKNLLLTKPITGHFQVGKDQTTSEELINCNQEKQKNSGAVEIDSSTRGNDYTHNLPEQICQLENGKACEQIYLNQNMKESKGRKTRNKIVVGVTAAGLKEFDNLVPVRTLRSRKVVLNNQCAQSGSVADYSSKDKKLDVAKKQKESKILTICHPDFGVTLPQKVVLHENKVIATTEKKTNTKVPRNRHRKITADTQSSCLDNLCSNNQFAISEFNTKKDLRSSRSKKGASLTKPGVPPPSSKADAFCASKSQSKMQKGTADPRNPIRKLRKRDHCSEVALTVADRNSKRSKAADEVLGKCPNIVDREVKCPNAANVKGKYKNVTDGKCKSLSLNETQAKNDRSKSKEKLIEGHDDKGVNLFINPELRVKCSEKVENHPKKRTKSDFTSNTGGESRVKKVKRVEEFQNPVKKVGRKQTSKHDTERNQEYSSKFVGAHCSIAGGVSNAVLEAKSLGARAFGLFVRNGRTWKLNPIDDNEAQKFKDACKEHQFPPHLILPHGSYLLNCGSSNADILKKSRDTFIYELQLCEKLGLTLYNFHPGSACGKGSTKDCIKTIADSINLAHKETTVVKTVIENMSCQGQTVGGNFDELKAIIDGVENKARVGVCLDTCHAFAAGFDLSSELGFHKMLEDFDKVIGLQYLCGVHLNDSKGKLGCHLDRHENIGKGCIGIEGFRYVMNDPRFDNIPMILETPVNDYAAEIKTLTLLENT